ncbi:hypothetical protein ACFYT3_06250 [Nocardia amikacinitolerans]|uniref:hypothetical protein n=1 Tax=Nocardia amikacinitolerans TaxID=756689 RepID=UPI0036A6EF8C
MTTSRPELPTEYRSTRERLVAGLVLIRAVVAGDVPSEPAWSAVVDVATLVRRLLDDESEGLDSPASQLLAWSRMVATPAELERISDVPGADTLPDDLLLGLWELAEHMKATTTPHAALHSEGPEIIVEQPDGRGVLLTTHDESSTDWVQRLPESSDEAVKEALRATVGAFPSVWPAAWPTETDLPRSVCWPPDVPFAAPATTLPIALWHLGRITGLGDPQPLSAGEIIGEACHPLVGHALATRKRAAKASGRSLLVPTENGWRLFGPDETEKALSGPLTLASAAAAVWGADWTRWLRERHAHELAAAGWRVIDWRVTPGHPPIADLDTTQSLKLARYFTENNAPTVAILGGTPGSGKSTAVRRLASLLSTRKRNPRAVQVIEHSENHELPDKYEAATVGAHALGVLENPTERPVLVFENLQPIGADNADEVFEHVARELKVAVLAVLQDSEDSQIDWQTKNLFTVTSVVGPAARRLFVDNLAMSDASLDAAAAHALVGRGGDLRRITQALSRQDQDARVAARFAELANSEREPLVRAAALSLMRCEIPAEELGALEADDRDLFGITVDPEKPTIRLAGIDDSLQLIDLYRESTQRDSARGGGSLVQRRNATIIELLAPVLTTALRDNRAEVAGQVAGLLIGSRLYHRAVCEQLLQRAEDDELLAGWCSAAPLMSVVRTLGLIDVLPEQMTRTMVEKLLGRLDSTSAVWHPTRLLALIRAVQDTAFVISDQTTDEFARWLVAVVDRIIADRTGFPEERFALLLELERIDSEAVKTLLAERFLDVLGGLRVDQVSSYRLVRKVQNMQRRLLWKSPNDVQDFPIGQEYAVQDLLTHDPHEQDGVGVLIESMSLHHEFENGELEVLFQSYEVPLTAAMRFATAAELADVLNSVYTTKPAFSWWLLSNWHDFLIQARSLMRRSDPMEAATLLRTIARSQSLTAARILCGSGDQVDAGLVRSFANRIKSNGDALGAGLLLSATHAVGGMFHAWRSSFAADLAEEIGEDTVRKMIVDPRMSACYQLVKALWEVGASYRDRVLDLVLEQVVQSVRRGRKHWGAEIALLLAADPELGEPAFRRLREEIPPEQIVQLMFRGSTAHSRVMFHRLGRVLYPEVATMYRDQWELHAFVEGLSKSAPTAALAVCAEVAKTLGDADVPGAGAMIFEASGGAEVWARRLGRGRNPDRFVHGLDNLIALDRAGARQVVEKLRDTPSRFRIGDRRLDTLAALLRAAMLHDSVTASALVRSIHETKPELAPAVFGELTEDSHLMYVLDGDLVNLQDPVQQATAARNFARAGLSRGTRQAKWITATYRSRVQTVKMFASPRRADALVCMLEIWDFRWGSAAVDQLDLSRIGRRVRFGQVADLGPTVGLIRTLCALDRTVEANQILDDLLATDIATIAETATLTTLCELTDILQRLRTEAVPRTLRILRDAVDRTVQRSVLVDERRFWQHVGRALWTLRHTPGGRVSRGPISEPRVRPNIAHSAVLAWVAAELDQPGWGDDARERAHRRLGNERLSAPVDQAQVLLATANGWAPELRSSVTGAGLERLPFWLLRMLYQQAKDDQELRRLLDACEPAIRAEVSRDIARPDWDASRIRLAIGASRHLRGTASDDAAPL